MKLTFIIDAESPQDIEAMREALRKLSKGFKPTLANEPEPTPQVTAASLLAGAPSKRY